MPTPGSYLILTTSQRGWLPFREFSDLLKAQSVRVGTTELRYLWLLVERWWPRLLQSCREGAPFWIKTVCSRARWPLATGKIPEQSPQTFRLRSMEILPTPTYQPKYCNLSQWRACVGGGRMAIVSAVWTSLAFIPKRVIAFLFPFRISRF